MKKAYLIAIMALVLLPGDLITMRAFAATTTSTVLTTSTTTTTIFIDTTTSTTSASTSTSTTAASTSTTTTSGTTTTVPGVECCDPCCTISVEKGEYIIQNNVYGATTRQCVWSIGENAFKVTVSEHNQSSIASYPSVYKGCHWGNCTNNSGLPVRVSEIPSAPFSWSVHNLYNASGTWNVAAKAWFSPTTETSGGYDGGAELTIWLRSQGMMPSGSQVGTVSIGSITWEVWYSQMDWNYVAYRSTIPRSSISADLKPFINDAVSRGYIQTSWYLHVMEAGFEIMVDGQNLISDPFSFATTTTSTTTTTTTTTSDTTSTTTTTVPVTSTSGSTTTTTGATTTAG